MSVIRMLSLPYGFTLTVGALLVSMVSERGSPGFWPAWLFVLGSCSGFCLLALACGVADGPAAAGFRPPTGLAVLNVVPVLAVPLTYVSAHWIGPRWLAFLVAGAVAVWSYALGCAVAATVWSGLSRE